MDKREAAFRERSPTKPFQPKLVAVAPSKISDLAQQATDASAQRELPFAFSKPQPSAAMKLCQASKRFVACETARREQLYALTTFMLCFCFSYSDKQMRDISPANNLSDFTDSSISQFF
jgi:hypothetical protein